MHKCDNPCCVNPKHLVIGTQRDNLCDMRQKGREGHGAVRGERQHMAKLTGALILEIRARRTAGATLQELAEAYGVSAAHVSKIVLRKVWAHIK